MMNEIKKADPEEKIRYVEELAPAEEYPDGDYWLTLTDAARVSKRQDKSVRDWVQQGKLPVRPVHLGVNKRTRQVRASDLEKITPILDRTAAITTEAGQVYLASIPAEMQAIRSTHEHLLQESTRLQMMVEIQKQELADQQEQHQSEVVRLQQEIERRRQELADQQELHRQEMEALDVRWQKRVDLEQQERLKTFETLEQALITHQEQQQHALDTLRVRWEQRLDSVQQTMHTEFEQRDAHLQEQHTLLKHLGEQQEAAAADLVAYQRKVMQDLDQEHQQQTEAWQTALDQQEKSLRQTLHMVEQDSQRQVKELKALIDASAQQVISDLKQVTQPLFKTIDGLSQELSTIKDRLAQAERMAEQSQVMQEQMKRLEQTVLALQPHEKKKKV